MWGSGAIWKVVRRPQLWSEAVRTVGAMARRGWWRRAPFLPVPDSTYMEWRRATAYGRGESTIEGKDLVAFLEWRRRFRAAGKGTPLG